MKFCDVVCPSQRINVDHSSWEIWTKQVSFAFICNFSLSKTSYGFFFFTWNYIMCINKTFSQLCDCRIQNMNVDCVTASVETWTITVLKSWNWTVCSRGTFLFLALWLLFCHIFNLCENVKLGRWQSKQHIQEIRNKKR